MGLQTDNGRKQIEENSKRIQKISMEDARKELIRVRKIKGKCGINLTREALLEAKLGLD